MNENYYKNMPEDFRKAVAVIKDYCQNEECAADCECDDCPYPLSMIRCGDRLKEVNYNCMTQADRIRSMSDEELAEWFSTVTDDVLRGSTWSKDGWMKYLQSEVE